jgi:hypothetical protein
VVLGDNKARGSPPLRTLPRWSLPAFTCLCIFITWQLHTPSPLPESPTGHGVPQRLSLINSGGWGGYTFNVNFMMSTFSLDMVAWRFGKGKGSIHELHFDYEILFRHG